MRLTRSTFVCPTEIAAFSRRRAEFEALECALAAVSVDSVHAHAAFSRAPATLRGLDAQSQSVRLIPLISDTTRAICRSYGVLDDAAGWSHRALVVGDAGGTVRYAAVGDAGVGRSVAEALRVVHALRHVDAHPGAACPADWAPGAPGISTR